MEKGHATALDSRVKERTNINTNLWFLSSLFVLISMMIMHTGGFTIFLSYRFHGKSTGRKTGKSHLCVLVRTKVRIHRSCGEQLRFGLLVLGRCHDGQGHRALKLYMRSRESVHRANENSI